MLFKKDSSRKSAPKLHVRKGDKVVVISGQYKSNEPREVLSVQAEDGRITVEGVNLRYKHHKRTQENPKGGRVQTEFPIAASKVQLFSDKLGKGTRTKSELVQEDKDGKSIKRRVRVGVKCGTRFD